MKAILVIMATLFSLTLFAQNTGGGLGGAGGGPRPTNDNRPLIEVLRDRANHPLLNRGNSNELPRPDSIRVNTGVHTLTSHSFDSSALNLTSDQIQQFKREADELQHRANTNTLPTRLHIESINLSSDEVSEITLKDGSVVKVEELQEFVRQKMKEKLNQ